LKPADKRSSKYTNKFDATVIPLRWTAVKNDAIQAFGVQAAALAQMEATVKAYIENDGTVTSPTEIPPYLGYARQLYKVTNSHAGAIATSEATLKGNSWGMRGLDKDVLTGIAGLFGLTVTLHW
jgi:hypothetical protein